MSDTLSVQMAAPVSFAPGLGRSAEAFRPTLFLSHLYITGTYAHVLVGDRTQIPIDSLQRMIDWEFRNLGRLGNWSGPIALADALEAWQLESGRWPTFMLVGHFVMYCPVRDPDQTGSQLSIGWFQDAVEPLLSAENRERIVRIDWLRLAEDFCD